MEALPTEPTAAAARDAAIGIIHTLEQADLGVATDRLWRLADLFLPKNNPRGFALVYGVNFASTRAPKFKAYLNADAGDGISPPERVRIALERLGSRTGWAAMKAYAGRGFDLDEPVLTSLDLTDLPRARFKVYFRHHGIDATELDAAMSRVASHQPGSFIAFARTLTGQSGPLTAQPPVTSVTFDATTDADPVAVTGYVPLWRYAPTDAHSRDRVCAALDALGIPDQSYLALLDLVAKRPLSEGRGIHDYLSLRTDAAANRVTVYWSPELYDRNPPARYQRP